jgi:predicted HTH domain antitoxin
MAKLDRYALGAALAERGIPRQYSTEDLDADLHYAGGSERSSASKPICGLR